MLFILSVHERISSSIWHPHNVCYPNTSLASCGGVAIESRAPNIVISNLRPSTQLNDKTASSPVPHPPNCGFRANSAATRTSRFTSMSWKMMILSKIAAGGWRSFVTFKQGSQILMIPETLHIWRIWRLCSRTGWTWIVTVILPRRSILRGLPQCFSPSSLLCSIVFSDTQMQKTVFLYPISSSSHALFLSLWSWVGFQSGGWSRMRQVQVICGCSWTSTEQTWRSGVGIHFHWMFRKGLVWFMCKSSNMILLICTMPCLY